MVGGREAGDRRRGAPYLGRMAGCGVACPGLGLDCGGAAAVRAAGAAAVERALSSGHGTANADSTAHAKGTRRPRRCGATTAAEQREDGRASLSMLEHGQSDAGCGGMRQQLHREGAAGMQRASGPRRRDAAAGRRRAAVPPHRRLHRHTRRSAVTEAACARLAPLLPPALRRCRCRWPQAPTSTTWRPARPPSAKVAREKRERRQCYLFSASRRTAACRRTSAVGGRGAMRPRVTHLLRGSAVRHWASVRCFARPLPHQRARYGVRPGARTAVPRGRAHRDASRVSPSAPRVPSPRSCSAAPQTSASSQLSSCICSCCEALPLQRRLSSQRQRRSVPRWRDGLRCTSMLSRASRRKAAAAPRGASCTLVALLPSGWPQLCGVRKKLSACTASTAPACSPQKASARCHGRWLRLSPHSLVQLRLPAALTRT
jgi:hypothetical protein